MIARAPRALLLLKHKIDQGDAVKWITEVDGRYRIVDNIHDTTGMEEVLFAHYAVSGETAEEARHLEKSRKDTYAASSSIDRWRE